MALRSTHWSNTGVRSGMDRYDSLRKSGASTSLSSYASSLARKTQAAEDDWYDDAYKNGMIDYSTYLNTLQTRLTRPTLTPLQRQNIQQKVTQVSTDMEESNLYTAYNTGADLNGKKVTTQDVLAHEQAKLQAMSPDSETYNKQLQKVNNLSETVRKETLATMESQIKLAYNQGGTYNGQKVDDNFMKSWEESKLKSMTPGTQEYVNQQNTVQTWTDRVSTNYRKNYRIQKMNEIARMPEDTSEAQLAKAKLYQELADMAKQDGDLNEALQYETSKMGYESSARKAQVSDILSGRVDANGKPVANPALPAGTGSTMGGSAPAQTQQTQGIATTPTVTGTPSKAVQAAQKSVASASKAVSTYAQQLNRIDRALQIATGDQQANLLMQREQVAASMQTAQSRLAEAQSNLQVKQALEGHTNADLTKAETQASTLFRLGKLSKEDYVATMLEQETQRVTALETAIQSGVVDPTSYFNDLDKAQENLNYYDQISQNPNMFAVVVDDDMKSGQGRLKFVDALSVNRDQYIPDVTPTGEIVLRKVYAQDVKSKDGKIVTFNDIMSSPKVFVREWVTGKDGKLKAKEVMLDTKKVKDNWKIYQSGQTDKIVPVVGTSVNAKTDVDLQPYVKASLLTPSSINQAKNQLKVNEADYMAAKGRVGTDQERAGDQLAVQSYEAMQAENSAAASRYMNSLNDPLNLNGTKKKSNTIMDMIWGGNNPFTGTNRSENTNGNEQSLFQKSLKNFFTGNFASPVYAGDNSAYSNTPQFQDQGFVEGTPDEYKQLIAQASASSGVPTSLLSALLKKESSFDPNVINGTKASSAGAKGIAQFMDATAKSLGIDALDPKSAIPGAAKYLKQLYDQFGSWDLALAAYNAGAGNVRKAGNQVPNIPETQNYVKTINQWMTSAANAANQVPTVNYLGLSNREKTIASRSGELMKSMSSIPLVASQSASAVNQGGNIFTKLLDMFKKNVADNQNFGNPDQETEDAIIHTVSPSETLRSLADAYGLTPIAASQLVGSKGLVAGQTLNIPKMSMAKYNTVQPPADTRSSQQLASDLNQIVRSTPDSVWKAPQPQPAPNTPAAALRSSMSSTPVLRTDSSGNRQMTTNPWQTPTKEPSAQLAVKPTGNPISNVTNAIKSGVSQVTNFFKKLFG